MHYTPQEEDRIRAEIDAAKAERSSALPPPEPQGQRERSRPATCSLPGSLVDDAVFFLSYGARMADELGRPAEANRMLSVASALKWRAQKAVSTVRQPEENNQLRAICADLLPWARGCTTSNPARAKAVKLAEAVVMPNSRSEPR